MVKHIKCRVDASENTHKKLKDIPRGQTFSRFGHEWIILEHDDTQHTLILAKDIIGGMPFDEGNCNNWATSSLRKYLNGEFLDKLCGEKSASELGFAPFVTDLTADDGLKDYGQTTDTISLLTCDLYRKHRDILKPIGEWWWLATPYSTLAAYSCNVRLVNTDGTLVSNGACSGSGGVRPLCYLSSEIFV